MGFKQQLSLGKEARRRSSRGHSTRPRPPARPHASPTRRPSARHRPQPHRPSRRREAWGPGGPKQALLSGTQLPGLLSGAGAAPRPRLTWGARDTHAGTGTATRAWQLQSSITRKQVPPARRGINCSFKNHKALTSSIPPETAAYPHLEISLPLGGTGRGRNAPLRTRPGAWRSGTGGLPGAARPLPGCTQGGLSEEKRPASLTTSSIRAFPPKPNGSSSDPSNSQRSP